MSGIDHIYIAASARDARFTRICVASVRYFYPDVSIKILVGGPLQRGLATELQRYWNVDIKDLPRRDYGWGFVKLEPLFFPPGERFLVLDSDTAFVGTVLDVLMDCSSPFIVDEEQQSPVDLERLYYDWQKVAAVDAAARPPAFVFNSGQWLGTSGIVDRAEFDLFLDWTNPPRLRHPGLFMPGDQGILNYVLNLRVAGGLDVARRVIMRWPGHSMEGISVEQVSARKAPPLVVHWAGLKKNRIGNMQGHDVLFFFERYYYSRIPWGQAKRRFRAWTDVWSQRLHHLKIRIRQFFVLRFYASK
jgi:hypothetical protein